MFFLKWKAKKQKKQICSFVSWENLWRANLLTVLSDLEQVQGDIEVVFLIMNMQEVNFLIINKRADQNKTVGGGISLQN